MRGRYLQALIDAVSPRLRSLGALRFLDSNYTGSTWSESSPASEGVKLTSSTAEWNLFKALFGQVSLFSAIANIAGKAATVGTFADLRALTDGKYLVVWIKGHTADGDGGEGVFDRVAVGSLVDDDMTTAVAGTWAYVRRGWRTSVKKAAWGGFTSLDGGLLDATAKTRAAINLLGVCDRLEFPKGLYKLTAPILVDYAKHGSVITGWNSGQPDPTALDTTFIAAFAYPSGTHGTITSVINHNPALDSWAKVAVLDVSGDVASLDNVEPGDTLYLSNTTLEYNLGAWTIMDVDPVAKTITYYGWQERCRVASLTGQPSIAGETNNGSLHWNVKKAMFKLYTRDVTLECMKIYGDSTVGACIDSGTPGAGGVPSLVTVCTNNGTNNVSVLGGVFGIKIGDFSSYASGGCSEVVPANNCELHKLRYSRFSGCQHSGIYIPNATGNSMNHNLDNVNCDYNGVNICIRRGGIVATNQMFTGKFPELSCDLHIGFPSEPTIITGGSSENSPIFLDIGFAGYAAAAGEVFLVTVQGMRVTSNFALLADGCQIRSCAHGNITFKGCHFFSDNGTWTIGVSGFTPYAGNAVQASMSFYDCDFPNADITKIVTCKAAAAGNAPVWYTTQGCVCNDIAGGTGYHTIPDGIHEAYGSPAGYTNPVVALPRIRMVTETAADIIINGVNNAVVDPLTSECTVTGPTADVTLNGMVASVHGERRTLVLKYDYDTTVNHNDGTAAAGNRFATPGGTPLTLYNPGADGFNTLSLTYDSTLFANVGGWRVTGYISGAP